jgi:hypothetical protein
LFEVIWSHKFFFGFLGHQATLRNLRWGPPGILEVNRVGLFIATGAN